MKKFGFGCMRFPMKPGASGVNQAVDLELLCEMIDQFMAAGFNYFDTARSYVGGKSESALRKCLVDRYPRDSYILTDKLSESLFQSEADIPVLFHDQLACMGVDYFDYYLMHGLNKSHYEKYTRCNAFELVKQFKAEGKIRHIGISFHDRAEVLDKILSEHPEIEVVQIQLNYLDYDDPTIQSHAVYQVCEKHQKPVIVMEPCKGGGLINLPEEAKKHFDALGGSTASYAIRYCASFDSVILVLSGMSTLEQVAENIRFMKEFKPIEPAESEAIEQVRKVMKSQDAVACTACRYCINGCPQSIPIPELLACYNAKKQFQDWNSGFYYKIISSGMGKASDCIECGACESACPQHLTVRDYLKEAAAALE